MQPLPMLSGAEIAQYFTLILGRPPESPAVIEHYARMGLSAAAFVRVLMDSDEVAERYRRRNALADLASGDEAVGWPARPGARPVLLFGAYGNGNLGDAAQAEAVAWLLARVLPAPLNLAACSWERRAPFAFPAGVTLAADALLRRPALPGVAGPDRGGLTGGGPDGGGLVVIGGGGLLGAPHFPLHAERWAEWFAGQGVPWALLGVGGSAEAMIEPAWRAAYRRLLGGAAFVGVRDAATLAAARAINPRACWFPDPVLARAVLEPGAPRADAASWQARPVDAVIIPRHPNNAADAAANRSALACRDRLLAAGRRVVVAGLERVLDAGSFAGEDVIYVDDWTVLMGLCREARVVVSLRLHGVVAAIAAGCVAHGLVQPKTGDLMATLGVADWFAADGWALPDPDFTVAGFDAFATALRPGIAQLRARLHGAMDAARQALGGAPA